MEYSRLEAGKALLRSEPVNLELMVSESIDAFRELATQKSLTLSARLTPPLPLVQSDQSLLRLVIDNLLHNAVKYTDHGFVEISAEINGDRLLLVVSDSGRDIPHADQERIFEAFEQLELTAFKASQGVGLGLALAKRMVKALYGTVRLQSAPGQGSRFTVDLPLVLAATDAGISSTQTKPSLRSVNRRFDCAGTRARRRRGARRDQAACAEKR